MTIGKNIQKNFFVLIFPIVLVLPLPLLYSSISLGLLCLNILVRSKKQDFLENSKSDQGQLLMFLLVSVFFLDTFLSFFSKGKLEFSFKEVRLSFIILPFIVFITKSKLGEIKELILYASVFGTLIYILYADFYLIYFYNYVAHIDFALDHFLKYNFNNIPGAYHHTYQGLYMLFSILILLEMEPNKLRVNRRAPMVLIMIILGHMFFMASKLTLVFGLGFVGFSILKYLLGMNKFRRNLARVFLAFFFVLSFIIIKNVTFKTLEFSFGNRLESWSCSLELLHQHPFFGTDESTIYNYLKNCVQSYAVSSHNQFLNELLNYGIFGFWLPMFFYVLFLDSHDKRLFRRLWYVILIISLFENVLSVQRGVLFVIFYFSLFYFCSPKRKTFLIQ